MTNLMQSAMNESGKSLSPQSATLNEILAAGRRQSRLIIKRVAIAVILAVVYCLLATKLYTGKSKILIDPRSFNAQDVNGDQAALMLSGALVDSEVEVIKSLNVLGPVIDKLDLIHDSEFIAPSLFGKIKGRLFGADKIDPLKQRERVFDRMSTKLEVSRVNKTTYLIEVDFTSSDKVKAAKITNAIAASFVQDQVNGRKDFARQSSSWLDGRLVDLQTQAMKADAEVQQFRGKHNLVLADGKLVNDQQLSDLNAQLANARISTYQAQAKFNIVNRIIQTHDLNSTIVEALSSPVIQALRQKQLVAQKRAADLSHLLNSGHVTVKLLDREAANYEDQIFGELRRIADSEQNDLRVSKERETAINDQIAKLTDNAAADNRTLVDLNQLMRISESYKALYQNFLSKYQGLLQRETVPTSEARVVEVAMPPLTPSWPRPIIIIPIATLSGLMTSIGLAMWREHRDKTFRNGEQLRQSLGVEFLGIAPLVDVANEAAPHDFVSTRPFSRMANTMRTARLAAESIRAGHGPVIIGIISASSQEGKSVIAANLAMMSARDGRKTLLIDGDLRRCGLSRAMNSSAEKTLSDVILGSCELAEAVVSTASPHLFFLPSSMENTMPHSSELLGCASAREFFSEQLSDYEYVVVDLPPLNALVDARAIAPCLTAALMVVSWGRTSINSARDAMFYNKELSARCVGAILNAVDMKKISFYEEEVTVSYGYSVY